MTVASTTVELEFSNVVAGTPIFVAIQTNGDPVTIRVAYGADRLPATINTDYVIVIAVDLLSFTLTPTPSLLAKIDVNGPNIIFVSRMVLLTTDFDLDDAFVREKLVSEFDEVWMALQQVTNAASGDVGDASQDAAAAAASAAAAGVSEDNAEAHKIDAQVAAASASGSANSAIASASSATTSATAAATSATNAANSALASANSATEAANTVSAIGNPATVAHTDITQTWTVAQTFDAAVVVYADVSANSFTTGGTIYSSGAIYSHGTSVIGNDTTDVVYIKGTLVNANISAMFDAVSVPAFGSECLNGVLGYGVSAPTWGDIIMFRGDQSLAAPAWRYHNCTGVVIAGLLGLPNV